MSERGLNAYHVEELCGVPQPTTARFLKENHGSPRQSTVEKWCKGLGVSEAALRGLEKPVLPMPDTVYIDSNAELLGGFDLWDDATPLSDTEVALPFFREIELSAGSGLERQVIKNHGRKLRFSRASLRNKGVLPENAYCVTVTGNSMEPVLLDGSTIGIDIGNTTIKNGDIYAIDHDGHLRVKMLYQMPGGVLRVRSFNSDEWPDEYYSGSALEDIRILGRMFWSSAFW